LFADTDGCIILVLDIITGQMARKKTGLEPELLKAMARNKKP
jgi:hypothetical protein